jgi:hypothetical protein
VKGDSLRKRQALGSAESLTNAKKIMTPVQPSVVGTAHHIIRSQALLGQSEQHDREHWNQ